MSARLPRTCLPSATPSTRCWPALRGLGSSAPLWGEQPDWRELVGRVRTSTCRWRPRHALPAIFFYTASSPIGSFIARRTRPNQTVGQDGGRRRGQWWPATSAWSSKLDKNRLGFPGALEALDIAGRRLQAASPGWRRRPMTNGARLWCAARPERSAWRKKAVATWDKGSGDGRRRQTRPCRRESRAAAARLRIGRSGRSELAALDVATSRCPPRRAYAGRRTPTAWPAAGAA